MIIIEAFHKGWIKKAALVLIRFIEIKGKVRVF